MCEKWGIYIYYLVSLHPFEKGKDNLHPPKLHSGEATAALQIQIICRMTLFYLFGSSAFESAFTPGGDCLDKSLQHF